MPGTGKALGFGNAWPCGNALGATFAGNGVFGAAFCPAGMPGAPGLAAGLIEALGGTGSFPCWISVARCATAGGSAGPLPAWVTPPCPGAPFMPSGTGGAVPPLALGRPLPAPGSG